MNETTKPRATGTCPLVAIGASAGGIAALKHFFEALPENPGVAFIVVLHLSPSHESHLVSVLQRSTNLDVVSVDESAGIQPNCIYVIAPNSVLTLTDDRIQARRPRTEMERRHPVDAIFQSLAAHRGSQAICIILSGSGANGSAGAQAVREHDGIVLAQDPDSAEHAEMPRNVILTGLADRVAPPEELAGLVLGYVRSAGSLAQSEEELAAAAEAQINAILSVLRARGNHDFSPYKKKTLVRRILRRMGLNQIGDLQIYAEKLRSDQEEVQALVTDLLINVTGFFRDREAWDILAEKAVTPIMDASLEGQPIRAWVPACSTGEEAYSVAMLLLEQVENRQARVDVKVFATDAAPPALARARAGLFPATIAEAIPAERLERFFDKQGDLYRAKKTLRDAVVFAPQNLLSDPPFSRLDLVTCRNLLIYLEPQVQEKVIALLHFALREGGFLFLGTAETVGKHAELFQPVSKKWRIYRRIGATLHELVEFPLLGAHHRLGKRNPESRRSAPADEAREALLSAFAPPALLIDEHHRILYYHGDLALYTGMPSGEPTTDLFSIVREELRPKLRAIIRQAAKDKARVSTELSLRNGTPHRVRLTAVPAPSRIAAARYLISFEASHHVDAAEGGAARHLDDDHTQGKLEEELKVAREELRLSVAELESSNEELKASNEEITSMNEELQSTNEELETSKEELQSLNEELNTVNVQLQSKVEELEDRTNDLNNLLNSTDIATLFLDDQFRIRWFSPPLRKLFQVLHGDVGRPITDFAQRFRDESFLADAREVLRSLQPKEKEVAGEAGRWHLRRILPYRTEDNRIGGVVATFTDITDRRAWEEALASSKAFAERIVDTTRWPLVVLASNLVVRSGNRAFYESFRLAPEQVENRSFFEIGNGDWDIPELRQALRQVVPDGGLLNDLAVSHVFRKLGRRHLLVNARKLDQEDGRVLLSIEDVTQRQEAERHTQLLLSELQHRVKNLLTKVMALITLSQDGEGTRAEFAAELKQRIAAIARTEELIGGRADDIALRELVEAEIASLNKGTSVKIEGPDARLTSAAAQTFSLALHELATNAIKYGALAQPAAALEVSWGTGEENNRPVLVFHWFESGVKLGPKAVDGFGSRLIREVAPQMLNGTAHWELADGGLKCTLVLPLSEKVSVTPAATNVA